MRKKRLLYYIVILIALAFFGMHQAEERKIPSVDTEGRLVVSYIDVGQGDSTLVEFPGGKTALIDAGETVAGETVVSYLYKRGCTRLDYVICTHPHSDHIGGMAEVIDNFEVGSVYMPRVSHNSKAFENLLSSIQRRGLKIQSAKAGLTVKVEPEVTMTFVAPVSDTYEELNDYSAAIYLTYNENEFLFTGDAEKISEEEMLRSGAKLSADVLKVGHHGSSSSSHKRFLQAVQPQFAVISCGAGNDYGHPHDAVLNRLDNVYTEVFRTDRDGTVTAISDGQEIQFSLEREH